MAAEKSGPYPPQPPYPEQPAMAPAGAPPAYPGPSGPGEQQPIMHPTTTVQPSYAPPPMGPQPGQPVMHQPGMAPPPGYVPGQPMATTNVIMVQQAMFRQSPVNCVCPHCNQNVITSTRAEPGGLTWLLCFGIALFGFWLGCCLIPFCIDDCQDIRHSCPNCKQTISVFKRL